MTQRIIWDTDELPEKRIIGTKAYNLMVMKRAGFPIPRFFTLMSDGTDRLTLEDSVLRIAEELGSETDLMLRSCHPMESSRHPFSGEFLSEWTRADPKSVAEKYAEVKESASSESVAEYVRANCIQGFNPHLMNVIFMQHFKHRFFSMFMTSAQNDTNEMIVNYYDLTKQEGDWELFDKRAGKTKSGVFRYDGVTEAVNAFGEVGVRAERLFRYPVQLEAAVNDGILQVFQAKEIELTDPRSLAKPSHYRTMITGLRANGYTNFSGPVLVLDELSRVFPNRYIKTDEDHKQAQAEYQAEIEKFMQQNSKYAVMMKELKDFVYSTDMLASAEKTYGFLNKVVRGAVVQFRNKRQSVVRHESWDNVEKGGAIIYITEDQSAFADRFHVGARQRPEEDFSDGTESIWINGTLTPINKVRRYDIHSGEKISILSNQDGVFVW